MANGTVTNPVLRVAIVEDSAADSDTLARLIDACPQQSDVSAFASGDDFLRDFDKGRFDLVFMDVYMPGLSGVETAERIRDTDSQVVIVFTTTSEDFTRESYRLNAYKYLLKPLVAADVLDALDLAALKRDKAQGATLAIVYDNVPVVIPLADIIFIEASNRRTLVHTADQSYATTMTVDALEKLLPSPRFLRAHRAYLVNLDHVDELLEDFIMDNGAVVYVTVKSHRKIKRRYEDYLYSQVRGDVQP